MEVKRLFSLALAVGVAAVLAGCAAAPPVPPVQQQAPAKPMLWRSIFMVQSDGGIGWHS